jgi:glycine betaine/proline transport system ATP-binding protein
VPEKVVVRHLTKVFGPRPQDALDLLRQGRTKDAIFQQTGMVVGVQDANFTVDEGEIFVLMGLSGSGKSTLIRLLNRLIEPTSGQVLVGGHDVAALGRQALVDLRRRDMAMVFQSFALLPHRNVLDNTAFGLEVAGVARGERERRAFVVLEQVGLRSFAHKRPAELSGGMQQRVGLARALAVNPSLMLMDEAFSALDPLKRTEMQELLLQLQRDHRRTIVFVSHDLDEAFRIGNRIAIMEGGRIVQIGTPDEILRNPSDDYVRAFFKGVDVRSYLLARDLADVDAFPLLHPTLDGRSDLLRAGAQFHAAAAAPLAFVVEVGGRLLGTVTCESVTQALATGGTSLISALVPGAGAAPAELPLNALVGRVVQSPLALPVVDAAGNYLGAVTQAGLLQRFARGEADHV